MYSRHLVKYETPQWPGQINLIILVNINGIEYYHTYHKNTIDLVLLQCASRHSWYTVSCHET